jgi:hypothetical protein
MQFRSNDNQENSWDSAVPMVDASDFFWRNADAVLFRRSRLNSLLCLTFHCGLCVNFCKSHQSERKGSGKVLPPQKRHGIGVVVAIETVTYPFRSVAQAADQFQHLLEYRP